MGSIVGGGGGHRSNVAEPGSILTVAGPASSQHRGVDLKFGVIPTSQGTGSEAISHKISHFQFPVMGKS